MGHSSDRPRFLNLLQIRMPATAWTSISHRISGMLLFTAIPFLTYVLQLSLQGEGGFSRLQALFASLAMKTLLGLMVWSLLHHVLAGLRFLAIDMECWLGRSAAQFSARLVNALGVLLTLMVMWGLW